MDVAQLRTLVYVSESGSLSKAADRLCIAQPALSRHVRLLEEELGVRLFDRHGRGMILTDEGRMVLEHAQRIMAEFEDIRAKVVNETSALSGRVSIGMPPSLTEVLALPLLDMLRTAYPNVIFRIVAAYSLYLLKWVHEGDVDVALLYDPRAIRSLKTEPLLEEEFFVVGKGGAELSMDRPVSFVELKGRPLILPSAEHSLRQIIDRAAHDANITIDVPIEADSYSALKQLVQGGVGWTILPLAAVQSEVAIGSASVAPLTSPSPKRLIEMGISADRPVSRVARAVQEAVVATAAHLVKQGAWQATMRLK